MAFTTVQGSGGAPDSFVGTTGIDAIALANSTGNFFLGANQAADTIIVSNSGDPAYSDVLTTATIKAGAGEDTLTIGDATNATIYTSIFVNGGDDRDTITFAAGDTFLGSTLQGGKANDTITTGLLNSSLVNGNLGVDTIKLGGAGTSSSVYGGGGNDVIEGGDVAQVNVLISGDKGNDKVTIINNGKSLSGTSIKGGDGVDTIDLTGSGDDADKGIFVAGNEGNDTLKGSDVVAGITLSGGKGDDKIETGKGAATTIGGEGNDSIVAQDAADTILYTAQGQGGALSSATSTAVVASADTVTSFNKTQDKIGFDASETLVGSSSTAVAGGINGWNMNNAGVFINNAQPFSLTATTTFADVSSAIGTVIGDAGDIAYAALASGNQTNIFQVTLGTTKTTTTALDAGDQIALLGSVTSTTPGPFSTANFSFV